MPIQVQVISNGNRIEGSPIRTVIIRVITKSENLKIGVFKPITIEEIVSF